jgi:hypothetical protein
MARVIVERGGQWDLGAFEDELGVPPIDVPFVDWPVLLIDGIIESDATDWLRYVAARTAGRFGPQPPSPTPKASG